MDPTLQHHLDALDEAHTTYLGYRRNLELAVLIARQHGATWPQVAEVLGLTEQNARERFESLESA